MMFNTFKADQFQEMNVYFTANDLIYHSHKLIIHISYLLPQSS